MAKNNNRKCICCSTEYRYCNSCREDRTKPAWYTIYHNENCKNLFNTASDYLAGSITKEEAKHKFDACDLSYKHKLNKKIVEVINAVHEEKKIEERIEEKLEPSLEVKEEVSERTENKHYIKVDKANQKRFVKE